MSHHENMDPLFDILWDMSGKDKNVVLKKKNVMYTDIHAWGGMRTSDTGTQLPDKCQMWLLTNAGFCLFVIDLSCPIFQVASNENFSFWHYCLFCTKNPWIIPGIPGHWPRGQFFVFPWDSVVNFSVIEKVINLTNKRKTLKKKLEKEKSHVSS
jgi:hypothetical protein